MWAKLKAAAGWVVGILAFIGGLILFIFQKTENAKREVELKRARDKLAEVADNAEKAAREANKARADSAAMVADAKAAMEARDAAESRDFVDNLRRDGAGEQ